jgi:hypothetical protein
MAETLMRVLGFITGSFYYKKWFSRSRTIAVSKTTQAGTVLKHLKHNRTITSEDAKELYQIVALRSVIHRLRMSGYKFHTHMNGRTAIYSLK